MITHLPETTDTQMNETHAEELEILKDFIDLIDKQPKYQSLLNQFEKLIKHIQFHFDSEERRMREHHYPMYRLHKGEHDKILNQIRFAEMEFRNRKDTKFLKTYLEEDFAVWLVQHIKAMDITLAEFIFNIQD